MYMKSNMQASISAAELEQFESLILSLYQPNLPHVISATQTALTQAQNSSQAWSLANWLLDRPDEKVRFFGALTIIVKLNTDSTSLGPYDAEELLSTLIDRYLVAIADQSSSLVTRKLSSALATYYLHFHNLWPTALRHLLMCIYSGRSCRPKDLACDQVEAVNAIRNLQHPQIHAALWVVTNIVDDVTKYDLSTANNLGLYDAIVESMPEITCLITTGLATHESSPIVADAIRCVQSLVTFTQRSSSKNNHFVHHLRPMFTEIIELITNDEIYDTAVELVTDLLSNNPSLLSASQQDRLLDLLCSAWSGRRLDEFLLGNFDFDSLQYGQLLLAFSEAKVEQLMRSDDARSQSLLQALVKMLTADGFPAVEDKLFVNVIEFWATFAETITDNVHSELEPAHAWTDEATSVVLSAVSNAWQRLIIPSPNEFHQWDSSERAGFHEARKDVLDFLQSTYTIVGPQIIADFAKLLLVALSKSSWHQLEATAFCLGGLAECTRDDGRCDDALASVFSSDLFTLLQSDGNSLTSRVRQTCISLIEHYTDFFERNVTLLPSALNLLFSVVGNIALAATASKSISRLASSCRHHLQSEVRTFLAGFQKLSSSHSLDCRSTERIIGSIASIAEATPEVEEKYSICLELLSFVEMDVRISAKLLEGLDVADLPCARDPRCLSEPQDESPALHTGLRALNCLAAIGRAFKAPAESSIDLDASQKIPAQGGSLQDLQRHIIDIIVGVQQLYPQKAEVTEVICLVLRSGFSEPDAGLFVLPPDDVTNYLTRHNIGTPGIGVLVRTASPFISSLQARGHLDRPHLMNNMLGWAIELARQVKGWYSSYVIESEEVYGANEGKAIEPENDTELTQNVIDLVSRLVSKRPEVLVTFEPASSVEFFFMFTLGVLDGNEPLPKAAAAEFWVGTNPSFYDIVRNIFDSADWGTNKQTSFLDIRTEKPELQNAVEQSMSTLGPMLSKCLARNMGGAAFRSELDKLSEPLKKLVTRHRFAKDWLLSAFEDSSFPSSKVTPEQKVLFVRKVIGLRGSRATNQAVRDFWLSARGSSFAYAS